ncbi:alpha/beta hydrolase [Romboutsia weinsteinii]|uniref:Alpha/beta hydrolase n=1 Tax=Romboutsia weinsteinii TaxID=2020949 RepID=A0A371J4W4_9FIRM|nr:alpha/beta hydrolase [Romboutsia weinsteinii]RDY27706.1 alpha/beta hydrolase [Romboutsia weinsteinii]
MKNDMEHLKFYNLGCTINYWYRAGSEDKWVLFFHGAGVDHEMFKEQFKIFDETYNIIAWDARGHGLSKLESGKKFEFEGMISDCKKIYEIYNIEKATIIGQSMGGNIAQEIAYYYPDLVDKIVLIDCSINTGKLTFIENYILKYSKFMFNCYPWDILVNQSARACSNKKEIRDYVKKCYRKIDKGTFIEVMMEVTNCLHEDEGFRFRQPVLLICGSDDKLGNIKKALEKYSKDDDNCVLHIIDKAGHNSNQDNPDLVNKLIYSMLNGTNCNL